MRDYNFDPSISEIGYTIARLIRKKTYVDNFTLGETFKDVRKKLHRKEISEDEAFVELFASYGFEISKTIKKPTKIYCVYEKGEGYTLYEDWEACQAFIRTKREAKSKVIYKSFQTKKEAVDWASNQVKGVAP